METCGKLVGSLFFKESSEVIIHCYGEDDYSLYFVNEDVSVRGSLADIISEIIEWVKLCGGESDVEFVKACGGIE